MNRYRRCESPTEQWDRAGRLPGGDSGRVCIGVVLRMAEQIVGCRDHIFDLGTSSSLNSFQKRGNM